MTKTLYDQAMEMYQRQDYIKLRAFKKLKKKSWTALGINAEMEARIMRNEIIGTNDTKEIMQSQWEKRRKRLELPANLSNIRYIPREIHVLKSQSSHSTIAHMAQIKEQEKFRADPRFPLFQMMQRAKRYKEIFAGRPYLPIFG